MEGKFYIKSSDNNKNDIEYCLYDDSTLMSPYNFGNYELLLGDGYHISIGIDKEKKQCLSIICLLDAWSFENRKINFSPVDDIQYDLMYISSNMLKESGEHYVPFVEKCYCDFEKSILAFGDIYENGKIISFNNNSFAKLNNDKLLAVFIKVSDDVISYIKSKKIKKDFSFLQDNSYFYHHDDHYNVMPSVFF